MKNDYIETIVNKIPIAKQIEVYNKLDNWEWFEELPEDEPNYYVPNSMRGEFLYFLGKAIGRYYDGRRLPASTTAYKWEDLISEKKGGYYYRNNKYLDSISIHKHKNVCGLTREDLIDMLNKLDGVNNEN